MYRALKSDGEYADWLDELERVAGVPDELEALEAITRHVEGSEPLLRAAGRRGIRARRLGRLLDLVGGLTSLELVHQLTREVVLADDVLPQASLRAALSLGAADVVRSYLDRLGAEVHEYAAVEARLRREGEGAERAPVDTWTGGGRAALARAAAAVRGDAPAAVDRRPPAPLLTHYAEAVDDHFKKDLAEAQRVFDACDFVEARTRYESIAKEAARLAESEHDEARRASWQRWTARARLNVAACSMNLQAMDAGRAAAEGVQPGDLAPGGRYLLAMIFAYLGELSRARALLPDDTAGLSEEEVHRLASARQIVAVRSGEIPVDLLDDDVIHVEVAQLLLERGDYAGAERFGTQALDLAKEHLLTRARAVNVLVRALYGTIFEDPPSAIPIPVDRREAVVNRIEEEIAGLAGFAHLDREVVHEFHAMTGDLERLRADAKGGKVEEVAGDDAPAFARAARLADQLAQSGKLDEALRALPVEAHPWRDRFHRAQLAAAAGANERAIAEATALAREFPGRAPVEHLAAELFLGDRRPEKALDHARRAFAALPGRGFRLLLGRALFGAGILDEAWKVLLRLDVDAPEVLMLRAQVADGAAPAEAPLLWERYLARSPDDGRAQVRRAQALFKLGRTEDAARVAWDALEAHGEQLDVDAIMAAAVVLRVGGERDERATKRLEAAAKLLARRFPGDAKAELGRFQLLASVDAAVVEQPIDWAMLERHGAVKTATIEETLELLGRERLRTQALYQRYRSGALPFITFCDLTGVRAAEWMTRFSRVASDSPVVLSASIGLERPPVALRGAEILVSDPELILLVKLDLVDRLKGALGREGRLIVLREVWERVSSDYAALKIRPVKDYRRLAEIVAALPKPPRADEGEAARIDVVSPRALVNYLFDVRGILDRGQRDVLLRALPVEDAPDAIPERMLFGAGTLQVFHDAGVLLKVLGAFPGQVFADPETERMIYEQREQSILEAESVELAGRTYRAVAEGLREGWIRQEEAPRDLPSLPPMKDPSEAAIELVKKPLEHALRYRQAMAEHGEWRRLVADFFGVVGLGAPQGIQSFAWASPEDYRKLSAFHRQMAERDIYLPALVRLLLPTVEADRKLEALAELGFCDALGAEEILRLERRFEGLAKVEPRRILDKMEWMAREPGHLGGDVARLRLVSVYGDVVWSAFCGKVSPAAGPELLREKTPIEQIDKADAEAIGRVMLGRIEAVDAVTGASALEHMIASLALHTAERRNASFVRAAGESGGYILADESPGTRLWGFITDWAGKDPLRRAAYGRALREVWAILDELRPNGPSRIEYVPLSLTYEIVRDQGGVVSFEQPAVEAVAILSANWTERPLAMLGVEVAAEARSASFNLESVLRHGGTILGVSSEIDADARTLVYPFPVPALDRPVTAYAPFEAVVLRAGSEVRRHFARAWARYQGPEDGLAYAHLMTIAQHPDGRTELRSYARRSVTAIWRLVRDDPAFLRLWPRRRGLAGGARVPTLQDLRDILSEPGALPPDKPLGDILMERVNPDGVGDWSKRLDVAELFFRASELPGSISAATLGTRLLGEEYAQHVTLALARLDHPEDHPSARLAGDIYFLRVAAVKDAELRERLPERLSRVLDAMRAVPKLDTMAAAEGALLRVCSEVVVQIARRSGVLPLRDHLWLTYRMFQWLCAQLAAIAPDARRAGIAALVAKAPRSSPQAQDVLDPAHFDRTLFDHRLATVLYALSAMEELAGLTGDAPPQTISSAAIEKTLAEVAEQPGTSEDLPSVLEWRAVCSVADLALVALLRLNPEGFLRLSSAARLRHIEAIPTAFAAAHEPRRNLARTVLLAATEHADALSDGERQAFEAALRAVDDDRLRWIGLTSLFGVRAPQLEAEARRMLLARSTDDAAPVVAGRFFVALSAIDASRLGSEVEALLDATARQERDEKTPDPGPGMVAVGLARVALRGAPPSRAVARDFLAALARRSPFQEDPGMKDLLHRLGIPEVAV